MTTTPKFFYKEDSIHTNHYMIFPQILMEDSKYESLSIYAKMAYMLFLNRIQLSQKNNWTNDEEAVYIIFTREELASKLKTAVKKAVEVFKELANVGLTIEKRCGRGFPNHIFLLKLDTSLDECRDEEETKCTYNDVDNSALNNTKLVDVSNSQFQTCKKYNSRINNLTNQELTNSQPRYINKNKTDNIYLYNSQSVSKETNYQPNYRQSSYHEQTDFEDDKLKNILDKCELWCFESNISMIFKNAIERLYYSESFKIGNAVLPRSSVRSYLGNLNSLKLQDALFKLKSNTERKIKNSTNYVMSVVFNSICEEYSDILIDPYLNSMSRGKPSNDWGYSYAT